MLKFKLKLDRGKLNLYKFFNKEKIMSEEDEFKITDEEIFGEEKKEEDENTAVLFGKEIEPAIEVEIEETSDFEQLFDLLKQKKEIAGSKQKYKADYLIAAINDFRADLKKLIAIDLYKITKKEGLRTKVLELAIRELRAGNL